MIGKFAVRKSCIENGARLSQPQRFPFANNACNFWNPLRIQPAAAGTAALRWIGAICV
jgi:hypothetical protein